jgi:hypothetical protein
MSKIETLAAAVSTCAVPGSKPKEIIAAVRELHPEASKKDVVRAAFYALTGGTPLDGEKSLQIHDLAISERVADEVPAKPATKVRKARAKKPAA